MALVADFAVSTCKAEGTLATAVSGRAGGQTAILTGMAIGSSGTSITGGRSLCVIWGGAVGTVGNSGGSGSLIVTVVAIVTMVGRSGRRAVAVTVVTIVTVVAIVLIRSRVISGTVGTVWCSTVVIWGGAVGTVGSGTVGTGGIIVVQTSLSKPIW